MTDTPPRGITASQLRRLCSRWPGVTTDIKWGDNLVFSVGGRMFAITRADGRDGGRLAFKVADGRFLELTDLPGMVPAPYLARARWVSVVEPARFTTAELQVLVLDAYALIRARLTKKLQAELGPLPTLKAGKP
jgi:predicted DNA-binding protein (MmcQ/YjbR family)